MQTKEYKDVLKNAQEVASFETTDRVLMVGPNGDQKRISKSNLVNQGTQYMASVSAGESGWYRLAQVSFDSSGIIKVAIGWGSNAPAVIFFAYNVHVNGYFMIKCISRLSPSSLLSKIRILRKQNTGGYIDVYAPITSATTFSVSLLAASSTTLMPSTSTDATVPEGYGVEEFTSANWGGVIHYCSTNYAILQKGGLRNGRNDRTYQCPAEKQTCGRDGAERHILQHRRMQGSRNIRRRRRIKLRNIPEFRHGMDIWCVGSNPQQGRTFGATTYFGFGRLRSTLLGCKPVLVFLDRLEKTDSVVDGKEVVAA